MGREPSLSNTRKTLVVSSLALGPPTLAHRDGGPSTRPRIARDGGPSTRRPRIAYRGPSARPRSPTVTEGPRHNLG